MGWEHLTSSEKWQVAGLLCVAFGVLFGTIGGIIYTSDLRHYASPHHGACFELAEHVAGLTRSECIQYWEVNPDATGQDVVDHFDAQSALELEKILAGSPVH